MVSKICKLLRTYLSRGAFIAWLLIITIPAFAQTNLNNLSAESMLVNFSEQLPNLLRLVTALSYVMGMYFVVFGIFKLKHYGEQRTMMSHEHSLMGALVYIIVGAALIFLPTTVRVGMSTFWVDPNPYGYLDQEDQWASFLNVCFMIMQFIGTIAFIRGLVLLSHAGERSHGQNSMAKGITHIVAGIFCINIYQFVQVIMVTLGLQSY